jgi:hypothetical protein
MMLNPSPLLGGTPAQGYVYHAFEAGALDYPFLSVACLHSRGPFTFAAGYQVQLVMDFFKHFDGEKTTAVRIGHGICGRCKLCHWTCDKFDWVSWLSDLQIVEMVLQAAKIKNVTDLMPGPCAGERFGNIHIRDTKLYFFASNLERVK